MKSVEIKIMEKVPIDRRSRNPEVSLGRAKVATVEKKNALRPNPARGKAVAVPL